MQYIQNRNIVCIKLNKSHSLFKPDRKHIKRKGQYMKPARNAIKNN